MKLYGLTFTKDTIGDIQRIVDANPAISRRSLSRQLCELFDWRSVIGRFKEVVCRKALVMLRNLGLVQLPDIVSVPGFKTPGTLRAPYQRPAVACSLQELGCVELILIDNPRSEQADIWKSLIAGHYLGDSAFYSGLRYLVQSSVHGYVGALSFGSYFAFTATPKNKTLEIFGDPDPQPDGTVKHHPFHSYTMKQAIQEGFILDVLKNYTPVESYYRLAKTLEDDPLFDARKAQKKLRRTFNDQFGNIAWKDGDKIRKVITKEIPLKVAADAAYQNATKNNDKKTARIEHDAALQRVIIDLLTDHTELFKQFSDNPSFKKWLGDAIFGVTYQAGQ